MAVFLFFALIIAVANAESVVRGPCPEVPPLAEFDAEKFSGDWYMIAFQPSKMEPAQLQCRKMNIQVADNVIKMTSEAIYGGRKASIPSTAEWDPKHGAVMVMKTMKGRPVNNDMVTYSILATDYTGYAASWTCVPSAFGWMGHLEFKWIWSRQPTLDEDTKAQLIDMMQQAGISTSGMVDVQCADWQ